MGGDLSVWGGVWGGGCRCVWTDECGGGGGGALLVKTDDVIVSLYIFTHSPYLGILHTMVLICQFDQSSFSILLTGNLQ